ncbi:MobQ family relaxase [Phocicoccus pinnipedialis]|uniref:MobA/MobL protein domain-containing protein n=1 Tax=Phocicoccus pinnipedialis TaxID=110845 RepID=A0A6V7RPG1_9BACL|nr:MobQ family relaxase [Jeotgalicoccus pinnipedialis]MBP1940273.1 hypothetical protein [Jeotgalicoccus pinnipedialis]CAD2079684.1 hypothetical protein JEOPIN946_01599 [Jeotgalicoccus pinnipedialis]
MAMYRLNTSIVSRGKGQNIIAKAAYNSASRIEDIREDKVKDYSNKQCNYSEIILPEHAPEEFKNRTYLWNSIELLEKRKDAQLAREIIISLPTEFDDEQNKALAKDFAESLSDEGMIVDLNIHQLSTQNPHAHLLCTLRGIDEQGNFEPKRIGNKKVRDWDNREKNVEWRKRWETIQNTHLEKNNFTSRVSAQSYADRNIDLEPTKTEGWKARKFEDETGVQSEVSKYNDKIREENRKKIDDKFQSVHNKISKKENVLPYLNKEDSIELKQLAKTLKLYVDPKNIYKEQTKISDLKNKTLLLDPEKREIKLDQLSDREEKLEKINAIFERRANEFFDENYPTEIEHFSKEEKIFIADKIINNDLNDMPVKENLSEFVEEKRFLEAQISLNTILGKRDISLNSIHREDKFFSKKLKVFLDEDNLTLKDIVENKHSHLENAPKIDYYKNKLFELKAAKEIINDYYDIKIKDIFPKDREYKSFIETTSTQEKEDFIDFIEFHGRKNTIEMLKNGRYIPRFNKEERKEITHLLSLVNEKQSKEYKTDFDKYVLYDSTEKLLEKYNINPNSSNDIKFLRDEIHIENDRQSIKHMEKYDMFDKDNNNDSKEKSIDLKQVPHSSSRLNLTDLLSSFSEIFKERMPKYMNKSNRRVHETETMSEKEKKHRRKRNRGMEL